MTARAPIQLLHLLGVLVLRMAWPAIALVTAVAMGGCAPTLALHGGPDVQVLPQHDLPLPPDAPRGVAQRPYRIGPFDKLDISVFGVEDLKREIQADASGRVSFPLAGTIEAGGLTPPELATEITRRLKTFVRDPQVTVNLKDSASSLVTVDGAVREPGLYPVIGRTTLVRAIASAKGLTETADVQHAVIFRTVNGKRYAALYSIRSIREGRYDDPEIFADDVVVVGESASRRFFRDLVAASPLLTAPIIALLR